MNNRSRNGRWRKDRPSAADRQRRSQAAAHILGSEAAVVIGVEGIEDSIAAEPFLPGDAAVTVEIVEQEDLVNRMGEGGPALDDGQAMGQLSKSGAQKSLRVYGSSASGIRPIRARGTPLAVSQPCSNLLPTISGVPLATPSAVTAVRRRQLPELLSAITWALFGEP